MSTKHLDEAERFRHDRDIPDTATRALLVATSILAHLRALAPPETPRAEPVELPEVLPKGTRVKFGDCPWVLTEPAQRRKGADGDWYLGNARNDLLGGPATEIMFRRESVVAIHALAAPSDDRRCLFFGDEFIGLVTPSERTALCLFLNKAREAAHDKQGKEPGPSGGSSQIQLGVDLAAPGESDRTVFHCSLCGVLDQPCEHFSTARPSPAEPARQTGSLAEVLSKRKYGPTARHCFCGHLWDSHNEHGCCYDDECDCNAPKPTEEPESPKPHHEEWCRSVHDRECGLCNCGVDAEESERRAQEGKRDG